MRQQKSVSDLGIIEEGCPSELWQRLRHRSHTFLQRRPTTAAMEHAALVLEVIPANVEFRLYLTPLSEFQGKEFADILRTARAECLATSCSFSPDRGCRLKEEDKNCLRSALSSSPHCHSFFAAGPEDDGSTPEGWWSLLLGHKNATVVGHRAGQLGTILEEAPDSSRACAMAASRWILENRGGTLV